MTLRLCLVSLCRVPQMYILLNVSLVSVVMLNVTVQAIPAESNISSEMVAYPSGTPLRLLVLPTSIELDLKDFPPCQ